MAFTADTGDNKVSRSDIYSVCPTGLVIDWKKNLSRNGQEPPVDEALIELAKDMMPKVGRGDSEEGSSGQLNPILVRSLPDRRLEVIGGFRRMRAALYLKESGLCPDFKVKYVVSKMTDAEAALVNLSENINREDPKPIQLAHAIRSLNEDYGMTLTQVAARLKKSVAWVINISNLVSLNGAIQDSIASGETTVAVGLELSKLSEKDQIATFNAAKESGGKVTVGAVKREKRARGENVNRSLTDLKDFLESKTGPQEPENGSKLAKKLLAYLAGETSEDEMQGFWTSMMQLPVETFE